MGLAAWMGWSIKGGVVFGLALSVASTVVLLRALQERRLIETERGRIAVGWLIVEDMAMVLALVLLPAFAGAFGGEAGATAAAIGKALAITVAKLAAFIAVMLIVGKRVIPWILHYMKHTGSRELFRLSVLVIALGKAFAAAELFGVSFALGAFFAGMILSESALSQQAAQETLPLRDAFAVLFFVSVGMLFNPSIVVTEPFPVLATLLIILVGKSIAAFGIVRAFGYSTPTALTISASLAQIGELSFILAGLGVGLALLPEKGRDLILVGAIISILLNPLLFSALDRMMQKREKKAADDLAAAEAESDTPREPIRPTSLTNHVVLVGHGRVGSAISDVLKEKNIPLFVIEDNDDSVAALKERGIQALSGNAADPEVIRAANLGKARCLFVAIPDALRGRPGRAAGARHQPHADHHLARSFRRRDRALKKHGATLVIMGEHEIAKAMVSQLAPQEPAGAGN